MDRLDAAAFYPKLQAEWNDPKKLEVFSMVVQGVVRERDAGKMLRDEKAWTTISLPMKSYVQEKLDDLIEEGVLCFVKTGATRNYTLSDDFYPTYVGEGRTSGHGDCDDTCPFVSTTGSPEIEDIAASLAALRTKRRPACPLLLGPGCTIVTETDGGFSIRKKGKDSSDEETLVFPFQRENTPVKEEDPSVTLLRQSGITIDDEDEPMDDATSYALGSA